MVEAPKKKEVDSKHLYPLSPRITYKYYFVEYGEHLSRTAHCAQNKHFQEHNLEDKITFHQDLIQKIDKKGQPID